MRKDLKYIFKIIKNMKIFFRGPKKFDVILYDRNTGGGLRKYLDNDKIYILDTRKESIYIFKLIKTLFKYRLKWNFQKYLYDVIESINPKVILTNVDNDKKFWSLKKKFKQINTVFIQNGFRSIYNDIFSKVATNEEGKYFVDKMFVFNDEVGKEYSKYIKGEIISLGSLNSNKVKIKNNENKGILFISEWGPKRNWVNKSEESLNNFFYPERYLFSLLVNFANSKKIDLNVLGRPDRVNQKSFPHDKEEEYNFFLDIAGNKDWNYISTSKSGEESYNIIDKSNMVVSISSTLGYEAMARGKKAAFFSCRGLKIKGPTGYTFAWPSELPDNGPFWTNLDNPLDFERIMNFLILLKKEEWLKVAEPYLSKCMKYDENNSKFINVMKNLNVPIKI